MAMKTIEDLKALLPTLLELFSKEEPEIGESYWDQDECGCGMSDNYKFNSFTYENDGWDIEVTYECCGEYFEDSGDYWTPACGGLTRAWGRVLEVSVGHYDNETEEETLFSNEELADIKALFNERLEDIA